MILNLKSKIQNLKSAGSAECFGQSRSSDQVSASRKVVTLVLVAALLTPIFYVEGQQTTKSTA
jgi:hypothetical protein